MEWCGSNLRSMPKYTRETQFFLKLGIILTCTGKQNSWTFRRIINLTETVITVCTFIALPTDVTNIFHKQNAIIMDFL